MATTTGELARDEGGRADGPRRRCFATRRVAARESLVRFVVDPDGAVVPDVAGTLPGRGLWLSADRDVVNTACARNLFAKGFGRRVAPDADLPDAVERLLARRVGELLGLARRAGVAAAGFEKARGLVASGRAGVVVVAADAGADGRRRFERAGVPVVAPLTAAEMSAALGREHAVYVAVEAGRLAERVIVEAGRLAGFRRRPATHPAAGSAAEMVTGR